METVLTLLLVRFALVALVVVVLALGVFAVVVVLRRRGRADQARAGVEQLVRLAATHLEGRDARTTGRDRSTGGAWVGSVLRRLDGSRDRR